MGRVMDFASYRMICFSFSDLRKSQTESQISNRLRRKTQKTRPSSELTKYSGENWGMWDGTFFISHLFHFFLRIPVSFRWNVCLSEIPMNNVHLRICRNNRDAGMTFRTGTIRNVRTGQGSKTQVEKEHTKWNSAIQRENLAQNGYRMANPDNLEKKKDNDPKRSSDSIRPFWTCIQKHDWPNWFSVIHLLAVETQYHGSNHRETANSESGPIHWSAQVGNLMD
jgi:hypothetical protein